MARRKQATQKPPETVAGHEVATLESFLLNGGHIPAGVTYQPYREPKFIESNPAPAESASAEGSPESKEGSES